ncbi:TorF family putative porin [soil metagenome]
MRTFIGCCCSLLAIAVASPALADDAAPPAAITINGGATVVTDYRFRGLSQTNKNFAVQGSLTVTHSSGLYVSTWGSSIDDYVASGSNQEIDLIAGYKRTFSGTTFDGGVLFYFYPGSQKFGPSAAFPGERKYNSDFAEPYISVAHTFGPVSAKATANYAWKQKALSLYTKLDGTQGKDDNLYTALDLGAAVPNTGIGFVGHVGHNWMRSVLSFDRKYTDWSAGVTYTYKAITFGVSYVDTNLKKGYAQSFSGKDIAKAGVVGSIGVSF